MATLTYTDAMDEALDRLSGVGFEHGPQFVNHAPMAAEALARMGYADIVPEWVEENLRTRSYHDRPATRWRLSASDEDDLDMALGDFSRVADWVGMFADELTDRPWREVLVEWWPRLLPGLSTQLTHGVIRTAHAVRALSIVDGDDRLERQELAEGLGYWAARFDGPKRPAITVDAMAEPSQGAALEALDELVVRSAGDYVRTPQRSPVPLIHSITGPAAVRLVVPYLPEELRWPSYLQAVRVNENMRTWFAGGKPPEDRKLPAAPDYPVLLDEAVALGDEHAIKLAEVAARHNAITPDPRLAAASHVATRAIGRIPV
jgi:hypothetical protein